MMRSMMLPLARKHSGAIRLSKITMGCALRYGNAGRVGRIRCLVPGNSMLDCLLGDGVFINAKKNPNL